MNLFAITSLHRQSAIIAKQDDLGPSIGGSTLCHFAKNARVPMRVCLIELR
jgi:hypothetical protein